MPFTSQLCHFVCLVSCVCGTLLVGCSSRHSLWNNKFSKGAIVVKTANVGSTAYWIVAGTNRTLPTSFFAAAGEEFESFDDLLSVLRTAPDDVTVMIGDSKMFEIDDNMQFLELSREELKQIDDAVGDKSASD